MYTEYQLERFRVRAEQLDNSIYQWGHNDCFSVLNLVYRFAGLKCLDRSVALNILSGDKHANYSQITEIVNELTVPAPSYPCGGILILTSNSLSYGTGLLVPGGILLSSEPVVRLTSRYALRKAARIVGCHVPKNHNAEQRQP